MPGDLVRDADGLAVLLALTGSLGEPSFFLTRGLVLGEGLGLLPVLTFEAVLVAFGAVRPDVFFGVRGLVLGEDFGLTLEAPTPALFEFVRSLVFLSVGGLVMGEEPGLPLTGFPRLLLDMESGLPLGEEESELVPPVLTFAPRLPDTPPLLVFFVDTGLLFGEEPKVPTFAPLLLAVPALVFLMLAGLFLGEGPGGLRVELGALVFLEILLVRELVSRLPNLDTDVFFFVRLLVLLLLLLPPLVPLPAFLPSDGLLLGEAVRGVVLRAARGLEVGENLVQELDSTVPLRKGLESLPLFFFSFSAEATDEEDFFFLVREE